MSIQIYSRKTNQQVVDLEGKTTNTEFRVTDAERRVGDVENSVSFLSQNLATSVRGILTQEATKNILDDFLASDTELGDAVTNLINERTSVAQAVADKFNGLIDLLVAGLEFENVDIHSYRMDVSAMGNGGGQGGQGSMPPSISVVQGETYTITHGFGNDAVNPQSNKNLNGSGGAVLSSGAPFLYDSNAVTVSNDPNAPYPQGFALGADGLINYGEYPEYAFPQPGSSVRFLITGADGAVGTLVLQNM